MQLDDANAPELTWSLWDDAHQGHGYATEAAGRVRDHLLIEQGWPHLTAYILPDNAASCGVAARLGAARTDATAPAWAPGVVTYHLTAEVQA